MTESNNVLHRPQFPRASAYDPDWVMENQMGPNALWLAEWLSASLDLKPGMRILDLGCGKAMTSIFFAREFGVQVFAADLWIHPDENWKRVHEAGADESVFPLQVEAHSLPFARDFFDAAVSFDAYQYFGTDALYLNYLSRFVKPGGMIGVVVPGLMKSFDHDQVPDHLTRKQANGAAFWENECICFDTAAAWQARWRRTGSVEGVKAGVLADGWKLWRDFEIALEQAGKNIFPSVAEALDWDQGEYIGFIRLTARRKADAAPMNLYDPSLIATLSGEE